MADRTVTSESERDDDSARRKRILYRCQHRGMKEMDILLGGYVGENIATMSEADLATLEVLMDVSDQELFAWMIGRKPVPAEHDTGLYRAIAAYRSKNS
ncbi:succinate dehydrogenase assembly factor 2 [Stappia sp. 28M-7]|jgi:antitoxin CptB|uniref:FAD assembly factor SdhE n=1 Tax=Stappia sp. 28M-7 TaxID=2762596 RepID=UPI000E7253B3|nr:succinate dehydrogenase assembly factor 2 [Stappia sp. 28M-7]MBC2859509.1 succinate dehydrogenase assembly factor 2 [Stappia sp. 28M-7]